MPYGRFAFALVPLLVATTGCSTTREGSVFGSGRHTIADASVADSGDGDAYESPPCPLLCATAVYETLDLNCTAEVIDAQLTGPCAPPGDASVFFVEAPDAATGGSGPPAGAGFGFACAPITKVPFSECKTVYFAATDAGVCHVGLTFADGFTYADDVTFFWQSGGGCGCPPYVQPNQGALVVSNPSSTCLDAGLDASGPLDGGAGE